mmetsp:Transcript_70339/g.141681  ORF Transcript_70339/g.141681 Transcript_70339/m.141681 type:complete len:112 (+) Transcript_70339:92-427(+)
MANVFDMNELSDPAHKIAVHSIECVLKGEAYDAKRVNGWTDEITKIAVEELARLSPNFKYAVSCTIIQKKGAGVNAAATAYWNASTDAVTTVTWEENRTIICILTIFGVAI